MHLDDIESDRCLALIAAGDFVALLELVPLERIVAAWMALNVDGATSEAAPDAVWWAWEFFNSERLRGHRDLHRRALVQLIDAVPEDQLCAVGAGPLEYFFSADVDDMRWLAEQACASQRFRMALGCMTYMNERTVQILVREGRWTFIES